MISFNHDKQLKALALNVNSIILIYLSLNVTALPSPERETDESWNDECRRGIDRVKNNVNFHAFKEG